MKLFIEEAHEELAKIQHGFPVWDENPLERDALITVRRSFHTLKGSGRMVGARDLGEFAWSIENLLNRVLDNTLTRSPAILETLRAAVAALPELVEQLENGRAGARPTSSASPRARTRSRPDARRPRRAHATRKPARRRHWRPPPARPRCPRRPPPAAPAGAGVAAGGRRQADPR